MGRSTKDAWLSGPGDLKEAEVEDVPVKGQSVLVRGLPAAYSNQASSEALELKTVGSTQIASVNTDKLEVLQFVHGVIEPQFTQDEVVLISQKYGPAFKKVIQKIDALSGVDKEALAEVDARFHGGGHGPPNGGQARVSEAGAGSGGPDLSLRDGGVPEQVDSGAVHG